MSNRLFNTAGLSSWLVVHARVHIRPIRRALVSRRSSAKNAHPPAATSRALRAYLASGQSVSLKDDPTPAYAFRRVQGCRRPARRQREDFRSLSTGCRDKLSSFAIARPWDGTSLLCWRKKWPAITSRFGFARLTPRREAVDPSREIVVDDCTSFH
jgi:hypothetical protein